jgi:adenylyl- and sulfurtransferase ThiI
VTSYSVRGVESARSKPTTTMPVLAEATETALLSDGFESPVP